MYCSQCGSKVDDNALFCPYCGARLVPRQANPLQVQEEGCIAWSILGFFLPLVGVILYIMWIETRPNTAKSVGKGIMSFVVVMFLLIIIFLVAGINIFNDIANDLMTSHI